MNEYPKHADAPQSGLSSVLSRSPGAGPHWAIVSDDLTGLQAIGGEFSRLGFRVGTAISNLPSQATFEGFDVYGYDTASRPLRHDEAARRVTEAVAHLRQLRAKRLFKHNDSILQGHVAAELRAFAAAAGKPVVYAPACPNRGRVTIAARQLELSANGEPLPGGVDVDLEALLQCDSGLTTRRLCLQELRAGSAAAAIAAMSCDIVIADAACDEDLDLLVDACDQAECHFVAGSVGLAAALARACATRYANACPILVVAGSLQRATREQTIALQQRCDCASIELPVAGRAAVESAARDASAAMSRGRHCVVSAGPEWGGADSNEAYPALAPGLLEKMRNELGHLLRQVIVHSEVSLGGLIVAGGTTADLTLRDVLGATRFTGLAWLCEGVTMAIPLDGLRPGMPIVTKSGGWGDSEALSDALDRLTAWRLAHVPMSSDNRSFLLEAMSR